MPCVQVNSVRSSLLRWFCFEPSMRFFCLGLMDMGLLREWGVAFAARQGEVAGALDAGQISFRVWVCDPSVCMLPRWLIGLSCASYVRFSSGGRRVLSCMRPSGRRCPAHGPALRERTTIVAVSQRDGVSPRRRSGPSPPLLGAHGVSRCRNLRVVWEERAASTRDE